MLLYTNLILILMVGSSFGWVDPRPPASSFGWVDPRPLAQCEDLRETCPEWVYFNYCDNPYYKTYMTIYCRRSCNMCTAANKSTRTQASLGVTFTSDPDTVEIGMKKRLVIRCAIDIRFVSDTEIKEVEDILIKRAGSHEMIGRIEQGNQPKCGTFVVDSITYRCSDDFKSAELSGELTGKKGDLEVVVSHATENHAGDFVCITHLMRPSGGRIGNKDLLTVEANYIDYLITELNTLKDEVKNKVVKKPEFNTLKNEVVKKPEFNTLKDKVKNEVVKKPEFNNLKNEVVRKQEITQGYTDCKPPKVNVDRYVYVNFGRTYAKPPRVFLSHRQTLGAVSGGAYGHNNNIIYASQITTTGFWLVCYTDNKMVDLYVYWIAFPSA